MEYTDSTNTYLKILPYTDRPVICIAEMQKKGRGQFFRTWHSPFGQNIYLSLRYLFKKNMRKLEGLSLVCGLAVCRTIEMICHLPSPIFIKWPNDIICEHKKLAGILIEIKPRITGLHSAIIGIGLNTNMTDDVKRKISQNWTSLINLTACYQNRNKLCSILIDNLIHYLEDFKQHHFGPFFQNLWKTKDYLFNKQLHLMQSRKRNFFGVGAGINDQGNLILKLSDGSKKTFSSGNINLINK
ncbi:biotin--[acetyl-CoA-carboxylase] ligase [Coxiella endosymbiont of Amblyomma americanum]|uniref:biotin--[acetyl-CoA-carboxylase] ligase n=1 Tax=Coxiella endosymbiont of Amblyomma americanum TaxID=325775 RepID=UPI00058239C1|nr:biotin--[acetyl-CoA-carboxylase] ligase [Coxiella endosymbiont of Amblyomma americanum]AJC50590.1 birA, biotin-[acetyl-CoA-carboxylase] ligase region [Coxiella endosymbiont of Amblyomma americanum]